MSKPFNSPPRWPFWLLERLCSPHQLEILYGDVCEVFYKRVAQSGRLLAVLLFYRDAFSLIRPYALKKSEPYSSNSNPFTMLHLYFRTGYRSLTKNKLSSLINLVGLVAGMTAVLLIAQYAVHELNYDKFHERSEDIYRLTFNRTVENEKVFDAATTFLPMGPELLEKFPEVENQVRFYYPFTHGQIKIGEALFNQEKPTFADPSYFEVFSNKLISGDPRTALNAPNTVILSEELARTYFGNNEPVGQVMEFSFEDGSTRLRVSGVLENPRSDSHLRLHMLISMSTLDQWPAFKQSEWFLPFYHTYLLINNEADLSDFETRASALLKSNRTNMLEKGVNEGVELQAPEDIHLDSDLEFELFENGNRAAVNLLVGVAAMILLIAYLNYVNLATARSVKRAKEVGVRKVMGSGKRQLIYQFLSESLLLSYVALGVSLLLLFALVPHFSDLVNKEFSITTDKGFWLGTLGASTLGAVMSGVYPAFVLSSFNPISILKGNLAGTGRGGRLRKVLVTFQFMISVGLIGGTMLLLDQTSFLMNKNLGFAADQVMVVNAPRNMVSSNYLTTVNSFSSELEGLPGVNSFTHSGSIPGKTLASGTFEKKGDLANEPVSIQLNTTDIGYFETYELEFLAGRAFSKDIPTDRAGLILNESALRTLRFDNAEEALAGKVEAFGGSREFNVLGVVKDYHHSSLKKSYEPIIFAYMPNRTIYFSFNLDTENLLATIGSIETSMGRWFPDSPFDYTFLDQAFDAEFKSELVYADLFKSFALLSILLGGLGLFGLVSFLASQKVKEISIRKVLGAGAGDILRMLSGSFLMPLAIGSILAWSALFYGGGQWLQSYPFHIELGLRFFVLPAAIVLGLGAITVGYQTYRATATEPTKALRSE